MAAPTIKLVQARKQRAVNVFGAGGIALSQKTQPDLVESWFLRNDDGVRLMVSSKDFSCHPVSITSSVCSP